jgi:hypothetical protein
MARPESGWREIIYFVFVAGCDNVNTVDNWKPSSNER